MCDIKAHQGSAMQVQPVCYLLYVVYIETLQPSPPLTMIQPGIAAIPTPHLMSSTTPAASCTNGAVPTVC